MTSNSALNCLLPQQKNLSEEAMSTFTVSGLFAFLHALILECAVPTEPNGRHEQHPSNQ